MNQLVTWTDALVIGIPEVDAQHKALVGLLNDLHVTVHRRVGVEACRAAVRKLRECALSHLEVEEKLMHLSGHGAFLESAEEQRELVRQLDGMLVRMDDANSNITFHGLHQLKVWLLDHIRSVGSATRVAEDTQPRFKVFGLPLTRS